MSIRAASSAPTRLSDVWEDEAELRRQVADGDRKASREMVDRYLAAITRFAARLLGDRAEAEDVAQETFLRLWRQAHRWQPRARLSTWLYRVAHNLCVDRLRSRQTRAAAPPPEPPEGPPDPGALLESRDAAEAVAQALGQLPERQRAAMVLTYYEGLRNYEAAEVMDVTVDALESLLARARRQLKKQLVHPRAGGAGVRDHRRKQRARGAQGAKP